MKRSVGPKVARLRAPFLLCGILALGLSHLCAAAVAPVVTRLGAWTELLSAPARVAADAAGRVYVTDPPAGRVLVLDAFGRVLSVRQGLAGPLAVAVDAEGTIFVSEQKAGRVSAFDAGWHLRYKLGSGDDEFVLANHLAVDPDPTNGAIYVCDGGANEIKVYRNGVLSTHFGSYGQWEGEFDFPAGVFVSLGGEVFVVDQNNQRVQVFDRGGVFQRSFRLGPGGMGLGPSGRSQGITGDGQGRVYVADTFQGIIRVFDLLGNALSTIGGFGEASGQFRAPVGLAVDPFNRLCVASANNGRVELIGLDAYAHVVATPARLVVAAGSDVTFSVAVGGNGPFTYQWRKGLADLNDGGDISGARTATVRLAEVTTNDSGSYSVVVTGAGSALTGPDATLNVLTPPAILSQPTNWTVTPGATVELRVEAAGGAISYQWRRNGADVPGATGAVLALADLQLADTGNYSVMVSNAVGAVASTEALLLVRDPAGQPWISSVALRPDGRIEIRVGADTSTRYALESSADLMEWSASTNFVYQTGLVEIVDPEPAGGLQRFYRVRWSR